ncbi:cell adhesion molecule CEACAM8-like [Lissotriton helveticus]
MGVPCAPRPRWAPSPKALILTAWLGIWVQQTLGQEPGVQEVTARKGETATLSAPANKDIFSVNWFKGTSTSSTQKIIMYLASTGRRTPGPQHTGRETVLANGSLRIANLRSSDSGNYTATVTQRNGVFLTGTSQHLRVYGSAGKAPPPHISPGLSVGATVGIVIGVLAAVIIIVCALVYVLVIKKHASGYAAARNSPEMAPNDREDSPSPMDNQPAAEIQFSSVSFVPERGTPATPVSPENAVYSEVRR